MCNMDDLEIVTLSEVNQTEEKYHMTLICGIQKEMIQMNLQNRNRLTDLENEFMVIKGEGQRRQWHPTLVLLSGKYHGWRSLVSCRPWGR